MSTIYEILEDYPAVNNVTELLDSDILILPNKKKEGSFGEKQPLGLADLNKNLKIKYYCDGKLSYRFEASIDGFLNLGILVVQLVNFAANLLVISNYITKSHNSDKVKITIVHGDLYNNCQIDVFEGNGYDISENISNLKGNYK